jgi:hypothetical protein
VQCVTWILVRNCAVSSERVGRWRFHVPQSSGAMLSWHLVGLPLVVKRVCYQWLECVKGRNSKRYKLVDQFDCLSVDCILAVGSFLALDVTSAGVFFVEQDESTISQLESEETAYDEGKAAFKLSMMTAPSCSWPSGGNTLSPAPVSSRFCC